MDRSTCVLSTREQSDSHSVVSRCCREGGGRSSASETLARRSSQPSRHPPAHAGPNPDIQFLLRSQRLLWRNRVHSDSAKAPFCLSLVDSTEITTTYCGG